MLSGVTNGSHWNTFFVHDGKLSLKRVFAIENYVCEQVQRQEQGLRCARLAHDEGRRANAHANEERKRVLPDGIVPSDANLPVELVDNETIRVFRTLHHLVAKNTSLRWCIWNRRRRLQQRRQSRHPEWYVGSLASRRCR